MIEVPRDQYNEIKNRLQKDIVAGNMDGIEPGTPAENYLKKGYFSIHNRIVLRHQELLNQLPG